MPSAAGAEVEGLRDFSRAVTKVSKETAKEMRREMKSEVAEPVAVTIRGNVPVGPGRDGTHWYQQIKAGATGKGAHITWGRKKVPYAGWMEFGGQLPSKASGRPARVVRTREGDGRYVYPEIGRARDTAQDAAQQVLDRTFRRANLALKG